jgi:photosystem II stability/assembly factor-like uncharacterized protein
MIVESARTHGRNLEVPMAKPYFLAAAVLLAAVQAPATAAVGRWTPVGPSGGQVNVFAVDPANRSVVYAGTPEGGVFKSTDGAATWVAADKGLSFGGIVALAIDPTSPTTLYAAGYPGLFVSGDGGAHWRPTSISPYLGEMSLACDPGRPNAVFVANGEELWTSNDRGRTWKVSQHFRAALSVEIAADPAHSLLLALVSHPGGFRLHGSADHGATWKILSAVLPLPLNPDKWQLAVDPEPPGSLYLAYSMRAPYYGDPPTVVTFQSNDSGGSWHLAGPGGLPVAVGPAHAVYAGKYRSTDLGRSWTTIAAPAAVVYALAVGSSPDAVIAATGSVVVLRSSDGGQSWQPSAQGLNDSTVSALAIDPSNPARLYVVEANQGFLSSGDGGGHWRGGICIPWACAPDQRATTLAVDPTDPATVYMASPTGLYKSTDGGAVLATTQPQGIGCLAIGSLVLAPSSPSILYAAGALTNGTWCGAAGTLSCTVFKSLDGGASWDCLGVDAISIAIAPSSPSTLYAVGFYGSSGASPIFRSTDQGATWEMVNSAVPMYFPNFPYQPFLVVDPVEPRRVYAADWEGGLWRSVDGGRVWREIDEEGSEQLLVAIDPFDPAVIYTASGAAGVLRSADFGRSWQPLLSGFPPPAPIGSPYSRLLADPRRSGTVYLATVSNGVLTYTVPKESAAGTSQPAPGLPDGE